MGLIGLAIRDVPRWRRDDPNEPLSWTLTEVAPGAVIAVVATVGAIASLTASIGGLYWLAAAMAIATAFALMNSWVLLVEIKR